MSVKSNNSDPCPEKGQIVRSGYLKKMKTMRKKWFVLRAETADSPARLEYYDSEKKFNCGVAAKRSIPLKTCFNINKRKDMKHKYVIALYTKDDCFCIQLDSEEELDSWLKALLSLQHGEDTTDGETPKPTYEHVWQVQVLNRGIGTANIIGCYSLCLTEKTLKLIKKDSNDVIDLNLTNIRSCGYLKEYFLLEIGRSSTLGPGELWMDTGDENIAQNINSTVYHAMSTNSTIELGPKSRNRSSSATESSKPNATHRKPNHAGLPKTHLLQQDPNPVECQITHPVTTSSSQHPIAGGLNWSGNISHQRTQSLPLAHPITTTTAPTFTDQNTTTTSHPLRVNKRPSSKCASSGGGRERCDSMPTRPRTTSEGNHSLHMWTTAKQLLAPYRSHNNRDISHSPPTGSPISPPSVGCSTESSGSSYSLVDDPDIIPEVDIVGGRFSHPLTPDEAIAEEDSPDSPYGNSAYVPMAPPSSDDGYVDMSPGGRHNTISPTHSMNSVTSGTPSTDMRFCEYTLEKVTSYFTPAEDDSTRPARAYSVGSRPEYRSKMHVELAGTPENARVRAFSVGSKTKKGHSRVLQQHHQHPGVKSSSAPILSFNRIHSSHGSIGPMDDLMEMDFSQSNSTSMHSSHSGYMDMKPGNTTPSGYVEMKPGTSVESRTSVPESPYVDMSGSSPANSNANDSTFVDMSRLVDNSDYMDMQPKKYTVMPSKPATSPVYPWHGPSQPIASHPEPFDTNNYSVRKVDRHSSFSSQLSSSPNKYQSISPKYTEGWLNSHYNNAATTPEGYVEMTPGTNKHQRQSSLDSAHIKTQVTDDYTNMTLGNGNSKKRPSKKEKSQPIMIQGGNVNKISANPSSVSPFQVGRKYSTGTPPGLHLPVGQYSSLPRPRSRKNSRRDSKDSSSSSVTTPSSSSTIFSMSLNSPCSPVKPVSAQAIKVPTSVLNTKYKPTSKANSEDYTFMDYEKPAAKKDDKSEYVNYNPAPAKRFADKAAISNDGMGDYAIMKPGAVETQPAPSNATLASKISSLGFHPINDGCNRMSPKPGDTVPELNNSTESLKETARSRVMETSTSDCNKQSRPSSTSSELCSSTSTLTGSRPESVNSDRIPTGSDCPRPSSVSCDTQLHYASLDLAPTGDEVGNRSPRTCKATQAEVNHQVPLEPQFTYAQIDFVKSEGLKHNSLPNNAKVKH